MLPRNCYGQGKAIQQLGPDIPFFRIHGTNQHKAGRVRIGNPFPFYRVHTHGRCIQQYIHHMVVQQVDFINV